MLLPEVQLGPRVKEMGSLGRPPWAPPTTYRLLASYHSIVLPSLCSSLHDPKEHKACCHNLNLIPVPWTQTPRSWHLIRIPALISRMTRLTSSCQSAATCGTEAGRNDSAYELWSTRCLIVQRSRRMAECMT